MLQKWAVRQFWPNREHQYALTVYGHARIPITSWLRNNALARVAWAVLSRAKACGFADPARMLSRQTREPAFMRSQD
jgi:hypothetical protein